MEQELVDATKALVVITGGLVVATLGLALFAALQWRAAKAAERHASRQADLLAESLEVSRRTLSEAEQQRALNAPFVLRVALEEHHAGNVLFNLTNSERGEVMRLQRVEVRERPVGPTLHDESLAEGTLAGGEGWKFAQAWDATRVGVVLELRATGHRIGGPVMTIEFLYRINAEGRLDDLASRSAVFASWA